MPEDVAIASRKSEFDTCTDDRDIDRPKSADRQTDGFSALYSRENIRSSFTLCQKPRGLTTYLLFFIKADTTGDLLIMHACDTFCDQLILLHVLFQSDVITVLYCN